MARRVIVGRSGKRRQVTWVGPADQDVVTVATTAKVIVAIFDPAAAGLPKPTIIRTRGFVSVRPSAFSADIGFSGAFGACIVSDQAAAAGVASVPGPFSDADWDGWYMWRSFAGRFDVTTDVGRVGFSGTGLPFEVDSKAMRKVSDNETCLLVAESQTGAFSIAMHLRTLFKLS